MAENLAYEVEGSKCFGENGKIHDHRTYDDITLSNKELQANCQKYGRLYNWETAKKACPTGWHLPSKEEWQELVDFAGGKYIAGKRLKSEKRTDWHTISLRHIGTNDFQFTALPGGYGYNNTFSEIGSHGYWWSSTETAAGDCKWPNVNYCCGKEPTKGIICACYCDIGSNDDVARIYFDYKINFYSVRCVQD